MSKNNNNKQPKPTNQQVVKEDVLKAGAGTEVKNDQLLQTEGDKGATLEQLGTGAIEGESMSPEYHANGIEEGAGSGSDNEGALLEGTTLEEEAEVALSTLGQAIASYAEIMLPNRAIAPKQVAVQQMELYHTVEAILNKKGAAFAEAWKEFLAIVADHPEVFSDANMFRGFREIRLAPAKRERYINLMILVMSTANPAARNVALKAIDLNALLKDYPADVAQNIQGFYQKR